MSSNRLFTTHVPLLDAMNLPAVTDLGGSFPLPDAIFNLLTEFHPTVALWSDNSPISTSVRNYLLTLTSVLQYNSVLDLRPFPRAVVFLIFQNLSAVTAPKFEVTPHPKTRMVLLTNDERFGTSNKMERNEETPRLTKIPNFHGEEIVVTLINNSVYSYLEPWVNSSGEGWKVEGFHALYLEKVCHLMNLSIVYRGGDWYGKFENGTVTPGIYKDLIEGKTDASAVGAFLRPEAVGLVEYGIPWDTACIRYLVPRPKLLNSSSRVFSNVFSQSLWLTIAISVLLSSSVAAVAARVSSNCRSRECYRNIHTGVMRMLFHLLQLQHPSRAEYRNSMVPLLVVWGWMGFIITAMYSSQLAASFTKPVFTEKIQTEAQFIEHGYTWGSPVFVDEILHFDMSDPVTNKWVTDYNERETYEDRNRKMRDGSYVVVGLSYGKVFFFRESNIPPSKITDEYEVADECTLKKHIGILFSLGSPYLEGVNLITRRLISGGILQKFEYDEMMKNFKIPPNVFSLSKDNMNNVVNFSRLPISIFYGPMYFLLCGYLISATVLVFHECAHKNTGWMRRTIKGTRRIFFPTLFHTETKMFERCKNPNGTVIDGPGCRVKDGVGYVPKMP